MLDRSDAQLNEVSFSVSAGAYVSSIDHTDAGRLKPSELALIIARTFSEATMMPLARVEPILSIFNY